MMISAALMAFLHHLMAFTVTACLAYEFIAYRRDLDREEAYRIQRVDLVYGITAGLVLLFGLLRVFFFEKGAGFYARSPFFWVKIAVFVIVGLLSVDPTIRYIRWNRSLSEGRAPEIGDSEYRRTRLLLQLEMAGIVLLLLAAPLMARGVGI